MVIFVQRLTQGCSLCSCQPLRSSWSTLVHHSRMMSKFGQRNFATIKGKSSPQPSKALDESMGAVSRTRNIGIIAHIDAGKTTTTERMLFYSGASESIGEVHTGDTITDYMDQERERGITITSASVTFPWRKHKINLLDTPGHVDFTIEVERCLSVLDSAVVILDSTAGVEAQTNTVWQQAERYNIPKIVYLNKMDKPANDVDKCLKSLEALECIPVPIQLPLFKDNKFIGIYDVISPSCWKWNFDPIKQGLEYDVEEITSRHEKYETIMQRREDLISHLADMDDQMSELVLNNDSLMNIDSAQIINSLRRSVIKNQIIPVLLGSSYKNIGVQPLMDAILRYLPSPLEKPNPIATYYKGNFCASAFKVIHHKNLGPLTFIRVFSGRITPQEKVYNLNRDTVERISKIYLPMADDFHEINVASLGHIVAVSGLTSSVTSDTLTSSKSAADEARACFARENSLPVEESSPVLASINIPEPVFFCTIEAPSMSKQKELDIALDKLQREDPSLRVNYDPNTDQTILSGMGELHLEIIRERIRRDFNIDVSMGKLRVSYREYPKDTLEGTMSKEKNFGGVKNHVTINLRLRPSENFESKFKLKVIVDQDNDLGKLRTDRLRAIKHGVGMALNFGPLASFPVHGVDVDLLDFKCTSATLQSFVSSVTSECVAQLLKKGGISLLEPIMQLQVICPEVYYNRVMNDLIARRGQLISMTGQKTNKIITFLVPLVELVSYSTFLRTITSGTAFFTMQIDCYRKLSDTEQAEAMEKMFGF